MISCEAMGRDVQETALGFIDDLQLEIVDLGVVNGLATVEEQRCLPFPP
jgi:hypothetical protein